MSRSPLNLFNQITFLSTVKGKDLIAVEHLLRGSVCTRVQLTVAWENGKVKGKEKKRRE